MLRSVDEYTSATAGRCSGPHQMLTNYSDRKCEGLDKQPAIYCRTFDSRHTNLPERQISKGKPYAIVIAIM